MPLAKLCKSKVVVGALLVVVETIVPVTFLMVMIKSLLITPE